MKNLSFSLKIIASIILVFTWVYTIINFGSLPEIVSVHYGFNGKPDGFGSKNTLWFFLGVTTIVYVFLIYLSKNPNSPLLNIPRNLKNSPKVSELIVTVLNVLVMSLFSLINYESLQNALGKTEELSSAVNYVIGLMFLFIIVMVIYSYRFSKTQKQ